MHLPGRVACKFRVLLYETGGYVTHSFVLAEETIHAIIYTALFIVVMTWVN